MRASDLKRLARGAEDGSRRAAARLPEAAAARGLLDVGYGFAASPFGDLLVAATARGVVLVAYPGRDLDAELRWLAERVSPRVLESARSVDPVRRQLGEYFDGRRRGFDLPVDLTPVAGFGRRVLEATGRIAFGAVATYGEIAAEAGSARAYRAAGNALGGNPVPIIVPCHRVVHRDGGLGGYTGGLERKVALLRLEGVLE